MTRTGKIARLPREIRDALNRRLQDGECGKALVAWLNSLPEVQARPATELDGRPINEQNLSAWKQGGYQEWLTQQEALAQVRELAADAREVAHATDGLLTDHLATVVAARYAGALAGWNGEPTDAFRRSVRALRGLSQDIVELRRGDHSAARLKIEQERLDRERQKTEEEAVEHFKRWAQNPVVKDCLCAKYVSPEERAARLREIYGLPPLPADDAGTQAEVKPNGDVVVNAPDQAESE